VTRALLALFVACAGLVTTLFASGLTAKNHALAEALHHRERTAEMRAAAIEDLFIRVRGRVVGDSHSNNAQSEDAVSGSSSLGGSRILRSDVSIDRTSPTGSAAP
jgi:hypothetical protein